jgi:hypothetical protein
MSKTFQEYLAAKAKEKELKEVEIDSDGNTINKDGKILKKRRGKKPADDSDKETEVDTKPETDDDEESPEPKPEPKKKIAKDDKDDSESEPESKKKSTSNDAEGNEKGDDIDDEDEDDKEAGQNIVKKKKDQKASDDKLDKKRFNPTRFVNVKPEITEAMNDTVVITFGRMNPVTVGHEKLINKVISTARTKRATPFVYLTHTTDSKKNPLPYDQKLMFAQAAFGSRLVIKSRAKTIIDVAKELQRTFKTLILVVGSDRVKEFETLLNKYNGKEFKFDNIEVISAGERDPDAEGVAGMSASKMRKAAEDGDLSSFKRGLPSKLQRQAKSVYGAVRAGMGINEGIEEIEQDYLSEALTRQQRLRRKMTMRRMKSKIMMGRRRALKKRATNAVLLNRSRRLVYRMLKKRFSKGRYADMPYSARQRVDDRVKKISKNRIDTLMRRFLPKVKAVQKARLAKKIKKPNSTSTPKPKSIKKVKAIENFDSLWETFIAERVKDGKVVPNSPMGKQKLTGREVAQYYRDNPAAKRAAKDKNIKLAIELALDLSGNMNYAIKEIEKLKRNLSKHPEVKKALQSANESFDGEAYGEYTLEARMQSQDKDVKDLKGTQPSKYYKGVKKDTKDDRDAHFKSKAKMDDDNPKAYTPAPGDKDPKTGELKKTKTSSHTSNFKKMFGEELKEAKRPHMLIARNGKPVVDKRFKQFRNGPEELEAQRVRKIAALMQVAEDVEFIFESNPKKALKSKAEKSGISYGILKKVFDRGVAAWRTGHRPGTTPTQWGLARVNSFATKSKGTWGKADKDLADKVRSSK